MKKNAAETWLDALLKDEQALSAQQSDGVLWRDGTLYGAAVRYVAVAPDAANPFPRARHGEVGILQGWTLARCLREVLHEQLPDGPRAVIALVDVPSQAYGRREEALCLSLALAASVDAYAALREAGHAVVALIVGDAMSGGLLAHGYQAGTLLALQHESVRIQAMSMSAALRVTRRDAGEWRAAAERTPPIGYGLDSFLKLGILDRAIACADPLAPSAAEIAEVKIALKESLGSAAAGGSLAPRLEGMGGSSLRGLSLAVRDAMMAQWSEEP